MNDEAMPDAPMRNSIGQLIVTLKLGTNSDVVEVHSHRDPHAHPLQIVRERAVQLVQRVRQPDPNFNASFECLLQRIVLFRWDTTSTNMLQLVTEGEQLENGCMLEVVLAQRNERPSRPHDPAVHNYTKVTFCHLCGALLAGLINQGVKCGRCQQDFHKKCVFETHNECPANTDEAATSQPLSTQGLPHTFVVHSYRKPTICKHCGKLLIGLFKQGVQCRDCRVNAHRECAAALPYDCRAFSDLYSTPSPVASSQSSVSSLSQSLSTMDTSTDADMIPVHRLPAHAVHAAGSSLAQRAQGVIEEGWLLHFTNHQTDRRLRHYWVLDTHAIQMHVPPYNDGMHRKYKTIELGEILHVKWYDGPPLDGSFPPHCFEIATQGTIYYVGENLDWYMNKSDQPTVAKLPRRDSGVGFVQAKKWLSVLQKALLPPPLPHQQTSDGEGQGLLFSQMFQVNVSEELGSGQFGTVYGGVQRSNGREVAIKVIAKERFGKKQQSQLIGEVNILQSVKHPGIIRLYEMYQTPDKIFVVMEKMKADMLEMILSSRMSKLSERHTKFMIAQILHALRYLHNKGIAHCDLKPENVLLSSPDTAFPQIKLCDFGYARFIEESQFRQTMVGTPAYLAPEVLLKKGYNKSLDMWSLGVVIYVTLSGTFPFRENEEIEEQIQNAAFMYPRNEWGEISTHAVDMINHLLKVAIEERYTIEEALEHPWLDDVRLYMDVREMEEKLGVRYLTTAQDDARYLARANALAATVPASPISTVTTANTDQVTMQPVNLMD